MLHARTMEELLLQWGLNLKCLGQIINLNTKYFGNSYIYLSHLKIIGLVGMFHAYHELIITNSDIQVLSV